MWNSLLISKNISVKFCLTKLSCTHQAHKNSLKSGCKKKQRFCYPPLRFLKLKIFSNFQNYRISHLDLFKWFLIFKIDIHTPGTPKSKKMTILVVKKVEKNRFFCDFSCFFNPKVTEMKLEIVLNILNEVFEGFYPNRPVSAKIRNLAYFFS